MKEQIKKAYASKAFAPTCVVLVAILILLCLPDKYENTVYKQYERCKAKVISVNNSGLSQSGLIVYGQQSCRVEIITGNQKGQISDAMNMMTGSLENDKLFEPGEVALVLVGANTADGVFKVTMIDHYRLNFEFILICAFAILLIALAGWIGVRAILSFIFTVLCIWKILIPLFLGGYNAILCGAFITTLLTSVIIVLVYGFDRRFAAALTGTLLGTGVTALLAIIFVRLMNIQGAVMNYSESLLYSGYENLNLTEIFIASIFIASSGALTDIAVDITSAVNEVVAVNPNLRKASVIKAGMNVGRAALGTMTTTLLLAYSGGYIGLLMVFVAQGTPLISIVNLNYVSAEILNIIIGSFGLVTVAPFTAIVSGTLLAKKPYSQTVDSNSNL